jgi:hypothetical protein
VPSCSRHTHQRARRIDRIVEPGLPTENWHIESSYEPLRDECLNVTRPGLENKL